MIKNIKSFGYIFCIYILLFLLTPDQVLSDEQYIPQEENTPFQIYGFKARSRVDGSVRISWHLLSTSRYLQKFGLCRSRKEISEFKGKQVVWLTENIPGSGREYIDHPEPAEKRNQLFYALCQTPSRTILATTKVSAFVPLVDVKYSPPQSHPWLFTTEKELQVLREKIQKVPWMKKSWERMKSIAMNGLNTQVDADRMTRKKEFGLLGVAQRMAFVYALEKEKEYGIKAKEILLAVAEACSQNKTLTGNALRDSSLLVRAADAYDLIASAPFVSEEDRQRIENNLLRCDIENTIRTSGFRKWTYNWNVWHNTAIAVVGFCLRDKAYINEAIDGSKGIKHHLCRGMNDDGFWWERAQNYHAFSLRGLIYTAEAARRANLDLYALEVPDDSTEFDNESFNGNYLVDGNNGNKNLSFMFDALLFYPFPNFILPSVADSPYNNSLFNYQWFYELAYARYAKKEYAWLLNKIYNRKGPTPRNWNTWTAVGSPTYLMDDKVKSSGGRAISIRSNSREDRGCWVRTIPMKPGLNYTLSAKVKTQDISSSKSGSCIRIMFWDENNKPTADNMHFASVKGSQDWKEYTQTFTTPPQTAKILIEPFLWYAQGQVWWDDFKLTCPEESAENLLENGDLEIVDPSRGLSDCFVIRQCAENLPEAKFSIDSREFALNGIAKQGSSLFPSTGIAILRNNEKNPDALTAVLSFGPYGSPHGHPHQLEIILYGLGKLLLPDIGTYKYEDPLEKSWIKQTLSHNTLVVDKTSQYPFNSPNKGIWSHDYANPIKGQLETFAVYDDYKLVSASCDAVYEGVNLKRTIILTSKYLLDVYEAKSKEKHIYDYVLHCPLELAETHPQLKGDSGVLGSGFGYEHINLKFRDTIEKPWKIIFKERSQFALQILGAPAAGSEVILGESPYQPKEARQNTLVIRRKEKSTRFCTLTEPFREKATVKGISLLNSSNQKGWIGRVKLAGKAEDILFFADEITRYQLPDFDLAALHGRLQINKEGNWKLCAAGLQKISYKNSELLKCIIPLKEIKTSITSSKVILNLDCKKPTIVKLAVSWPQGNFPECLLDDSKPQSLQQGMFQLTLRAGKHRIVLK